MANPRAQSYPKDGPEKYEGLLSRSPHDNPYILKSSVDPRIFHPSKWIYAFKIFNDDNSM